MTATQIDIRLNGERRQIAEGATIADLLAQLGLAGDRVAVERNRQIASRDSWASQALAPGDVLEIVHFVGGG